MKVTVNIDCTPEEARAFLGLPDVKPFQESMMDQMQAQMQSTIDTLGPEAIMKTFFPAGLQGFEELQKMFWAIAAKATSGTTQTGDKPGDTKS